MRLFFTTIIWHLNYFLFKVVLFGNRRVLQRFERRLFKIIPLEIVRPIHSSAVLYLTAEYEIRSTRSSYMLQYARAEHVYAGSTSTPKNDMIVVPVRIYSPVHATKVTVCGTYNLRYDADVSTCHYTTQEFKHVGPGRFDGVIFLKPTDTEVQS